MGLPPTYSRRKRQAQGGGVDVYSYGNIPHRVRVQMTQILRDGLGLYWGGQDQAGNAAVYNAIVKHLCKEFGVHHLGGFNDRDLSDALFRWFESEQNVDRWLDGLEACLQFIDGAIRDDWMRYQHIVYQGPDAVIAEINARLREEAIGYEYVSGEIMRIDSQHVHSEVILPVLTLLSDPKFASANSEYRSAHEAYRHGRLEECLVDCGKALESVLKVIGGSRGWGIKETDTASKLVQAAVDSGFLAAYSQAAMNHLKGLIESSTPTIRNKMGGHGAGQTARVVPRHLAAFQLHQTAAVILFLAQQDAEMGSPP